MLQGAEDEGRLVHACCVQSTRACDTQAEEETSWTSGTLEQWHAAKYVSSLYLDRFCFCLGSSKARVDGWRRTPPKSEACEVCAAACLWLNSEGKGVALLAESLCVHDGEL